MKYNLRTTSFFMAAILLCLLGFSGVSHAVRLSGSCPTSHTMDMSGMTMGGSSEIKTGAKHAEAECSSCHGTDGNGVSASDDVPYLAGQEFMYLCAWLDACRKQGNKCESHEDIAAQLSDHDIVDLAMFYTHLPSNKWLLK
jgi:cytochrome c553